MQNVLVVHNFYCCLLQMICLQQFKSILKKKANNLPLLCIWHVMDSHLLQVLCFHCNWNDTVSKILQFTVHFTIDRQSVGSDNTLISWNALTTSNIFSIHLLQILSVSTVSMIMAFWGMSLVIIMEIQFFYVIFIYFHLYFWWYWSFSTLQC